MSIRRLRLEVRRAMALLLSASFLAACQGGAAAPPPFNTGVPPPPFGVSSVDTTTPTALTPVRVTAKGVNPALPVTATFTAASGFTITLNAVGIAPDGAIIVPVPLPMDPKTGVTGAAHLSLTLTQGSATTKPVGLDVQDLPQLSDFGTSLGTITRTYLNYEELALGRQLGEMTAMAASPINKVDVSKEKADVKALLQAVIRARNDVDRVITNNALKIPAGTINGVAVSFDKNALAMSDRMIGTYLVSMGPVYQPPGSVSGSKRARRPAAAPNSARQPSAFNPQTMTNILGFLNGFNGVIGPAASARSGANAETSFEKALGYVGSAAGVLAIVGTIAFGPEAAVVIGAAAIGAAISSMSVGVDLVHIATDIGAIMEPPPGTTSSGNWGNLGQHSVDLLVDGVGVALGGQGAKLVLNELSTGANVTWQAAQLLVVGEQQYLLKSPEQDRQTSENAGQQLLTPQGNAGFGDVTGNFTVMNSQGTVLSGLPAVSVGSPPFGYATADQNGMYDMLIPTAAPFDSAGQPLTGFDPVTGTVLGSSSIDLSGATPGGTITAPPMSGTCNDSDANAPDSDDPDCD